MWAVVPPDSWTTFGGAAGLRCQPEPTRTFDERRNNDTAAAPRQQDNDKTPLGPVATSRTADEDANKNGILDREELIGPEGNPILTATWGYMDGLSAEDNAALRATYDEEEELAGRSVLVYATRFPLMLVLVFGVIFLYFRSKGGYKPIELTEEDPT